MDDEGRSEAGRLRKSHCRSEAWPTGGTIQLQAGLSGRSWRIALGGEGLGEEKRETLFGELRC